MEHFLFRLFYLVEDYSHLVEVEWQNHVVFVAFAGGVRQQESVLQQYLDGSQDYPSAGNIMYNLLDGANLQIS